jgi:hypothetical protein
MTAQTIYDEFVDHGICVDLAGDKIRVKGHYDDDLIARIREAKPSLFPTLEKLKADLGDEWDEVRSDPRQLRAFALAVEARSLRESGRIPHHYTAVTECAGCGVVPIFAGAPEKVIGCPWCFNRLKGLPVPRIEDD